jgi:hypothetical protein
MPIEKPMLVQQLVDVHMKEFGYNSAEMARILCYNKSADFDSDFCRCFANANRLGT